MKYTIELSLDCETTTELQEKLQSFQMINEKLSHEELTGLADVLVSKPQVMDLIRPIINSDQDFSLMDIMKMTPNIYNTIKNK